MKKILLLATASLGVSMAANAQDTVNFNVIQITSPAAYTQINCTSTDTIKAQIVVVNVGPTALQQNDTILVTSPRNPEQTGTRYTLNGTWAVNDTVTFAVDFTPAQIANWGEIDANGMSTPKYVATNPIPNDTIGFNFRMAAAAGGSFIIGSENKGLYTPVIYNCTTSTNDINTAKSLNVYPNPTANNISFSYDFTTANNATVRVMDLMGRTLVTKDFGKQTVGTNNFTLDVAALSNGVYYVELVSGDVRGISKFTVSK